jgi:hypothetical protein
MRDLYARPELGHLTPQHLDLVAQHEQLGVLGGRTPRQQHKPPQCLAEQQVQQSKGHAAIMWPDGLPDELAAQHPRSTFWHPQGHHITYSFAADELDGTIASAVIEPRGGRLSL